ncbi:methylaspartate ammonia-lyase [Leisingera daeponensis]|uniref:methylaspartate ammonia-lyase n=1 Tax=Leisingera daeponensis TaxID=405746 RepID=A0ABS7NLR2_9RHOB|nr:methylaspartate ammonia-lyase [Leisingera daeponensis]MBY6141081.1 methylaspartate ammonia-lyase [Leisingera daeponensis]
MKIKSVHFAPGHAAYYFDDQAAIKDGAQQDGFVYRGAARTGGFDSIRQRGEAVSVLLELENGLWAQGDCAAVQYSGAGGRDPLFTAARFIPLMQEHLAPLLTGCDVTRFRETVQRFDALEAEGARLHTAIRYGVSQALLEATALATGRQKYEVICDEWQLPRVLQPLPLFGQSGDDRYSSVDKMVLRQVAALPHGLINNVPQKLGQSGGKLAEYVTWLAQRIEALRADTAYRPKIHIDVYGTIGQIFGNDPQQMADYLCLLEARAAPFDLYIEGPCDAGSKQGQMDLLGQLRAALQARGSTVKIVADEWCNTVADVVDFVDAECCDMVQIKTPDLGSLHNTVDAVLYCKGTGVDAYQGGTCNETDGSARACLHAAFATRPDRVLVKPGMGFDEGMTIVANEMSRILTISKAKEARNDTAHLQAI